MRKENIAKICYPPRTIGKVFVPLSRTFGKFLYPSSFSSSDSLLSDAEESESYSNSISLSLIFVSSANIPVSRNDFYHPGPGPKSRDPGNFFNKSRIPELLFDKIPVPDTNSNPGIPEFFSANPGIPEFFSANPGSRKVFTLNPGIPETSFPPPC